MDQIPQNVPFCSFPPCEVPMEITHQCADINKRINELAIQIDNHFLICIVGYTCMVNANHFMLRRQLNGLKIYIAGIIAFTGNSIAAFSLINEKQKLTEKFTEICKPYNIPATGSMDPQGIKKAYKIEI